MLGIDWYRFEPHRLGEGISKVRDAMLTQGSSPAAINNTLTVLRGIARTAHEMGEITAEELATTEAVPDVPDSKREVRLLAGWELSAVISVCAREGSAKGARDAALVTLMYAGGFDLRQVTDLKLKDWQAEDTLLGVGFGGTRGTSYRRLLPLGEDAAALLRRWVALRGSASTVSGVSGSNPETLFLVVDKTDRVQKRSMQPSIVGGILKKRAEEARVRRFSHKDLRRTAAADMFAAGARYSEVQSILDYPVPELEWQVLEEHKTLAGPKLRAVRLGSRHLNYFDLVGGFHFQADAFYNDFSDDAEDERLEWPDSFKGHLADITETPWGTVACGVTGEGPPVVLVHGTPWSSYCWRRVVPSLVDRHSVYAYDLVGHGESERTEGQDLSLATQARVLAWLIGKWKLEDPAVVAHGTGTAVTLRAHLLEGVRFGKIALINPAMAGCWLSPAARHIKEHAEAYRTMTQEMFRVALKAHLQSGIRPLGSLADLQPYLIQWQDREGQLAYVRTIEQLDEEHGAEVEPHLGSVGVPLLVLAGDTAEDATSTQTCAQQLYEAVPGARLGSISWCGPFLPEEAPEDVARALSHFLS